MKEILQAWNLRDIQTFVNISLHLKNKGKTLENAQRYLETAKREDHKQQETEKPFIEKPIKVCPQCEGVLKVFSLNKKELDEHPGMNSKWECCKTCSGDKSEHCGYVIYVKETIEEILEVK
jgi:hypothetical protein